MKKIFLLLVIVALTTSSFFAQNLLQNGNFDTWTDPSAKPDGWYSVTSTVREDVIVRGGYSAKMTAPGSSSNSIQAEDIAITAGVSYTFKVWVKINGANASVRPWIQWRSASANITENVDQFQPTTYIEYTDAAWQEITATNIAPSAATLARVTMRGYKGQVSGIGGDLIYWDDAWFGTTESATSINKPILSKHSLVLNTYVENDIHFVTNSDITIYNANGQVVATAKVSEGQSLNVSHFPAGVYVIHGMASGEKSIQKIVKK
jgi:hypothetical protein